MSTNSSSTSTLLIRDFPKKPPLAKRSSVAQLPEAKDENRLNGSIAETGKGIVGPGSKFDNLQGMAVTADPSVRLRGGGRDHGPGQDRGADDPIRLLQGTFHAWYCKTS